MFYFIDGSFYSNSYASVLSIPESDIIYNVFSYMTPQEAIYFNYTLYITGV